MNFEKFDVIAARLKEKEVTIPTDFTGALLFLVLGFALYLLMPSQIAISESEIINGRSFPTLLIILMIGCSIVLILQSIVKKKKGEEIPKITLNLLTEVKALIIMAILVITYVICSITDLFVIGAVFCAAAFLLYFHCTKKSYYVITIGVAVAIWAAFRFALGVKF